MPLTVTLNVFSGRPNPTWILSAAQEDELMARIEAADNLTNVKPSGVVGGLGYRGFSISSVPESTASMPFRMFVHEGIIDRGTAEPNFDVQGRGLEEWLLTTSPPTRFSNTLSKHVTDALKKPVDASLFQAPAMVSCPTCHAVDAPAFNPAKWNIPSVQPFNNCYNYANDQITNTFAQPGKATGHPIASPTCAGVQPSAVSDGLRTTTNFSTPLGAGSGWYVALVVWPLTGEDWDYHWYRQDKVGCWSHKPGSTPAKNTDNSGKRIADPKTCDRGPYTDFCGYMITSSTVTIR